MEAIIAFDIKKGISKNGVLPWTVQEDFQHFYNKTKCNVVIMGSATYFSIPESKRPLKNRLNIVLTREPGKYKEIAEKFKNLLFTDDDNIHENILLFPNKYSDTYPVLDNFFKIFFIGGNEIYKKYMPLCKTIWVTKMKEDYGCDLFFDYNLEDKFCEKKVFENERCSIFKYTLAQTFIKGD
jgi:dihydrofolate reductase